jgi:hypothetical protein
MGSKDLSCKSLRSRFAETLRCENSVPIHGLVVISGASQELFSI